MDRDSIDEFKNLPPEYVARFKAKRAETQAQIAQIREEAARTFKFRDSVHARYHTPDGRIDPNSGLITIRKWENDYGDTVYVRSVNNEDSITTPGQIKTLSDRIKAQKAEFDSLNPSEQSRISTEFTSLGDRTNHRFGAYLGNEALAQQFQKLK